MWAENINFRDYMNAFPDEALEYERLKICLAEQYPNDRRAYKKGKIEFFEKAFKEAYEWKCSLK